MHLKRRYIRRRNCREATKAVTKRGGDVKKVKIPLDKSVGNPGVIQPTVIKVLPSDAPLTESKYYGKPGLNPANL